MISANLKPVITVFLVTNSAINIRQSESTETGWRNVGVSVIRVLDTYSISIGNMCQHITSRKRHLARDVRMLFLGLFN
jgi:hypothetical protein